MDVAKIIKENGMLRGLSPRTIKTYSVTVEKFLRTYRLAPHQVTQNQIKSFLLRKLEQGAAGNTINVYLNGLKFFYEVCLRKKLTVNIKFSKTPKTLPEFLTQEECVHFFSCIKNNKHKLMITLMYSAGLRVSELLSLKVKDFQFEQNYGWVRQGKGKKDRVFIVAEQLADKILMWITKRNLENENYLFTNSLGRKMSAQTVRKATKYALRLSGIPKNVHPHTLRHSFATHLIENGYSVTDVQPLLGHSKLETTLVYTHLARPKLLNTKSPFDNLS
jgi:integrase/recombinase XerD